MNDTRRIRVAVLSAVLSAVLLLGSTAQAATLEHTLSFTEQDFVIEARDGYDHIRLGAHLLTDEIGAPQLPVVPLQLALPPGSIITGLSVLNTESTEIVGTFHPYPAQAPQLLPVPGIEFPAKPFASPSPARYQTVEPYPPELVRLSSRAEFPANTVAGLVVHPVQYLPERERLRFFRTITFAIEYESGEPPAMRRFSAPRAANALSSVLSNPEAAGLGRRTVSQQATRLDPDDFEYVVVTSAALKPEFLPLADWKTRKGVPATVVTIEWIETTYAGVDAPARLRAFIMDAHDTWGTSWVLLGGDSGIVPVRYCFAMDCEANSQPDDNDIPCDLYYADLDGDWNADGDDIYGEVTDDVDLIPDVLVGRASVQYVQDASAYVAKTLAWERGLTTDYQLDMLLAGEILWSNPYTDSGLGLDMIDRESIPPRYDPIEKQYQAQGNESRESVIASLNDGKCHFLHDGHAWFTVLGCGDGYLDRADASGLTNLDRQPLVYSIGCWPASFDKDCIAERLLENPTGGAAAFIGNSRYGWGSPGNPGYGYSDRFMAAFYRQLFLEGRHHAGSALAAAKAEFVPLSQSENVYRWHQYEVNLLGDPELPVWTDEPAILSVSHPDSIPASGAPVSVVVWTAQGTSAGALVCITNGSDVYERALTSDDGTASFNISTSEPHDLFVTVTAADCLPYESLIAVRMAGAYLGTAGITFDDASGGNGDGLPGPGETLDLELSIHNLGGDTALGVSVLLTTTDPWVTLLDDSGSYGDVPGGAQVAAAAPFSLEVLSGCPDGHVALLDATISAAGTGQTWTTVLPITVAAAELDITSYSFDDTAGGNGNGISEPGERVSLMLELSNSGTAVAGSPDVVLWTADAWIGVTEGTASLLSIPAGGTAHAVFEIVIAAGCPVPHFPELTLDTVTQNGLTDSDALVVSVGTTGFSTDFEGPAIGWSHGGANDMWKATDHQSHSGDTSWYCGQESSWVYGDDMDAFFDSPEFILGAETELSFWCWYDVTIYGVDGLYIQLMSNGTAVDTLDFIGSGGALETLGSIGNDWLEYTYSLNGEPGDTVHVRFLFVSDSADAAEGVYIDDVSISSLTEPSGTGVADDTEPPSLIRLYQNSPNPFTPSTTIRFALSAPMPVSLSIYSIQGRLIRTLVADVRTPGDHIVEWDGRDAAGTEVAAGVYLYRLATGESEETRKMILVR